MRNLISIIEEAQAPKKSKYLEPTEENIALAKEFVFRKWVERFHEKYPRLARDRPDMIPTDLTDSCQFSTLFAQRIFGGAVRGNNKHFYLVSNGKRIDLNAEASDVRALGDKAYRHNPRFVSDVFTQQSLDSCIPRVEQWVEEFLSEIS